MIDIFGNIFETHKVIFEVYIQDKLAQKQQIEAPKEMLMINFIQTVEQISKEQKPMKIMMIRQESVYDRFENKEKVLNHEMEFKNNAMIDWEENR